MGLSIWEVFQTLFRWSERTEEDASEEAKTGRFMPSPLDISVRVAHGGTDDTVTRELAAIDEQARELEHTQHDN